VSGQVVGSVVSSRDITDRILLESEKRQLEEQYRQSQKIEAIGRLAGGIAHDFNNLLTVINSYSSMAAEQLVDGDPLKSDIQEIIEAGQRASTLTRQLLAFSRKQMLAPRILDLNEVVGELEKMLRRLIGEHIELGTCLAQNLGRVNADPSQIEQVLMNLAVNARDAMPEGGKLTIETANIELDEDYASKRPDTRSGRYVMLAVTDTGLGMTPEVQERLFEPFFTTKAKGQGTGLGLATVYGIVKQSGGNIWAYSELGIGTTFKIYLPRVEATKPERPEHIASTHLRGNETVLVVEDEKAVRELTKRMLASAGYNVLVAANGGEALLQCEQTGRNVALVLTDVVMPQMSGKDLAGRLATLCPELKVLYMSGYTDDTIVHHGVLEPSTDFIAKPFTATNLLKKVRGVLDGR
jgi:nitrogen-specific signal transduction histidine kinase/CheY-like chemotaxis protein